MGPTWDLLFGVGKVFWGVTESRHLIDIINQTDLVEDLDTEDKLGQPMLKLVLARDWGTVTFFALPFFRERTFPGHRGRLRSALPVDTDQAIYDSTLEEWHPDFAGRWTHALGPWDMGLAHFWGTSREPRFSPGVDTEGRAVLIPHYHVIHQSSLDLQWTVGGLLGKLEAIVRDGSGSRFAALVAGFEYTFFGVFDSKVDVGVLAEYLYDNRGDRAPLTPFEDDIFAGIRLAFNDPQATAILAGVIIDRGTQSTLVNVEASRRISNHWKLELEVRTFLNISSSDPLSSLHQDHYAQFSLTRFF